MQNQGTAAKVLFVDEERYILSALRRVTRGQPWTVSVANRGDEALELLKEEPFDVVVSDMRMPQMSGDQLLKKVKELSPCTTRILLTGYADIQAVESAVNEAEIFQYVTKPWHETQLIETIAEGIERHRGLLAQEEKLGESEDKTRRLGKIALMLDKQNKTKTHALEEMRQHAEQNLFDALSIVTRLSEAKNRGDGDYARSVSEYTERVGRRLGLKGEALKHLSLAATLHKIGMICLPDELVMRPRHSFNSDERKLYQRYPVWGAMALANCDSLLEAADIVRHHREYINGKGFPDALLDNQIPLSSKILCVVCDFFELYSGKMEKHLSGLEDARVYMNEWMGRRYEPLVVQTFFEEIEDYGKCEPLEKTVSTNQLQAGMELNDDVYTRDGVLLLTKGSKLGKTIIQHLVAYEKRYDEKFKVSILVEVGTVEPLRA